MLAAKTNSKFELEKLFRDLPDMIDIEELMYRLYFLQKINAGETNIKEGSTLSHTQVIGKLSKKWQN
jgi:hypothetical protein